MREWDGNGWTPKPEPKSHTGVTSVDGRQSGEVCDECWMVKPCACQDGQL